MLSLVSPVLSGYSQLVVFECAHSGRKTAVIVVGLGVAARLHVVASDKEKAEGAPGLAQPEERPKGTIHTWGAGAR